MGYVFLWRVVLVCFEEKPEVLLVPYPVVAVPSFLAVWSIMAHVACYPYMGYEFFVDYATFSGLFRGVAMPVCTAWGFHSYLATWFSGHFLTLSIGCRVISGGLPCDLGWLCCCCMGSSWKSGILALRRLFQRVVLC